MKKPLLVIFIMTLISTCSFAQQGKSELGIAFDTGLPLGGFSDGYKTGFGGQIKWLYGLSSTSQFTLTTGCRNFAYKGNNDNLTDHIHIIPILVGVRSNMMFNGGAKSTDHFYIEPQIGYGSFGDVAKVEGETDNSSHGSFAFGIGTGIVIHNFDIGVQFEGYTRQGTTTLIGIHAGYNFPLGGK